MAVLAVCSSSQISGQTQMQFEFESLNEVKKLLWLHDEEGWPDMVKNLEVKDGNLIFAPWTSGWYADYMAPFLFVNIRGDFVAESRVLVRGIESDRPQAEWSLGGIMVRKPIQFTSSNWTPRETGLAIFDYRLC